MILARNEINDYQKDVAKLGIRNATENAIEKIFHHLESLSDDIKEIKDYLER